MTTEKDQILDRIAKLTRERKPPDKPAAAPLNAFYVSAGKGETPVQVHGSDQADAARKFMSERNLTRCFIRTPIASGVRTDLHEQIDSGQFTQRRV